MDTTACTEIETFEERLLRDGSPFALRDVDAAGIRYRVYRNGPQNLNDIYRKAALLKNNILCIKDGKRTSYDEVLQRARAFGRMLAEEFGVRRGTRVAIALENGPDWITAFIAITALGAIAVLAGPRDPDALDQCCELTRCSLIVLERNGDIAIARRQNKGPASPDALVSAPGENETPPPIPSGEDEAVIAFTSGSTGFPKAAILTQRSIVTGLSNMMFASALAGVSANSGRPKAPRRPQLPCTLLLAPLSHISGYGQMLLTLMIGGKLIFPASEQAGEIMRCIAQEKVTALAGATPAALSAMLNALPSPHDIGSLASVNISGLAIHPRLVSDLEANLPNTVIGTGYGMTETNGSICAIAGEALRHCPRSCGRLVPTVECRITDDSGRLAAPETAGTVWLRGAMVMRGYDGSDTQPFQDGWLNTGDVGYLTQGRHLHILDRWEDFVMTAAGRMSVLEIEHAVIEQTGMAEAAVICGARKSAPAIFILSANGVDTGQLRDCLMTRFGEFACEIVALDDFPRTLSGKIDRQRLKAWISRA